MSLLVSWAISSAAVWLTAQIVPGFKVQGWIGALIVAAVLGLLQVLIGWLIFAVIGIGTLGIGFVLAFVTRWIVTAILLVFTDKLTDSLSVRDFKTALLGSIVISVVTTVLDRLIH